MNDIPPKQAPDASSGNLVAMYQASGSSAESFPVLKAFQDYIDAERAQARKRVMILAISFSAVLCAVVICFLGMGIYLLKDMSAVNAKLIDAALVQRNAPVAPVAPPAPAQQPQPIVFQSPQVAPTPANDAALREVTKELADLRADIEKKKSEEARQAALVAQKQADLQLAEYQKLQKEIGSIKKENQMLKESFVMSRKHPQPPKPEAVKPLPSEAPEEKAPLPEPPVVATDIPVKAAPLEKPALPETPALTEKPVVAQTTPVPATKEPPVSSGIKAQEPQKGMMAIAIPLKTKNLGTVPWRVVIPE